MAESPAHKVGQIIGNALEQSFRPVLEEVARKHDLYVDAIGPRGTRPGRKLLTWKDHAGNKHNLDFVLERGGSYSEQGAPAAFIEVAWRRYTKHSVNKAGEIANALIPLRQSYSGTRPFLGAVVAGEWTQSGLNHLRNQGIEVLYLPLREIVGAFADFGIDVDLGESSPLEDLAAQIIAWDALSDADKAGISEALRRLSPGPYEAFRTKLEAHFLRQVERVVVLPLYGESQSYISPAEAANALRSYSEGAGSREFVRFEIQIRYNNGDRIDAHFENVLDAVEYLDTHS